MYTYTNTFKGRGSILHILVREDIIWEGDMYQRSKGNKAEIAMRLFGERGF